MIVILVLGLLIAAASAAFVGLLISYNTAGGPEYTVSIFDRDMVTLNSLAIFVSGVALALLFGLGLAMAMSAFRTHRRKHRRSRSALVRDQALHERSSQHAAAGEWQADPTATRREGAHEAGMRDMTDPPDATPPTGRGR